MNQTTTIRTPIRFSDTSRRVEGGYAIYDDAFLFEAGDYADKGFEFGEPDMDRAIARFKPISGNIDHTPFLKGRAFFIDEVRRDETDPKRLRGKVRVPIGLDELLTDAEKGFSAEWDRQTKLLVGGALTPNPRIKGASLVAKFAEGALGHADDPETLKETVAALAAFCACNHDTLAETPRRTTTMSRKEELQRLIDEAGDGDIDEGQASLILFPEARGGTSDDDDDDEEEVFIADEGREVREFSEDPEKEELRARLEALEEERRHERAVAFSQRKDIAERITPGEEPTVVALMYQALTDDALAGGTVTFSRGGREVRGTRAALVEASYAQRRPHRLTADFGAVGSAGVLPHGDPPEDEATRKARIEARLKNTSTGRAILARRNGAAR